MRVDLHAVKWLLVGSIPGVLAGSQLSVRLPDRTLRLVMATTLMASTVKLLAPPHANTTAIATLAAGLAAIIAYAIATRTSRRLGAETASPESALDG